LIGVSTDTQLPTRIAGFGPALLAVYEPLKPVHDTLASAVMVRLATGGAEVGVLVGCTSALGGVVGVLLGFVVGADTPTVGSI
jgi:hypothetical protein